MVLSNRVVKCAPSAREEDSIIVLGGVLYVYPLEDTLRSSRAYIHNTLQTQVCLQYLLHAVHVEQ